MSHDLLHDPLIQTNTGWHSLPGPTAAMARGEVGGFPALRPHQRPAWHMFLVQLGTMALDAAGLREIPQNENDWRAAFSALTADFPGGEPWLLVVPDRRLPAFLQPPDPGGLKWSPVATPDALDMLITARNHDLKAEIACNAAPQDWLFALVSLQTVEGYGGGGGYRDIARMNRGSSSRPMVALAPAQAGSAQVDPSGWWRRDVARLLASRRDVNGKRLLWLEPWPEGRMLELPALDPLFIEVCRRIRLVEHTGRITAERSTSKAARINAEDAKGNTGDPWAPVHLDGHGFTLGDRDWTHKLLVDLLFSEKRLWHIPSLARHHAQELVEPMLLVTEAFARGNSKTDGFRSRVVPVPKAMVTHLFGAEPISIAEGVLKDIYSIESALFLSLLLVASGGDEEKFSKNQGSKKIKARLSRYIAPPLGALQRQADALFFPELWARMAVTEDAGFTPLRLTFLERLAGIARIEFRNALPAIPCPSLMRLCAEVRGEERLERGLRKAISQLQQPETAHG